MDNGAEKLARDVDVIEAMSAEMGDYLDSDVLFWPMATGNMPMLTLGGYLMREHRLRALSDQLSETDRARVDAAVKQFNEVLANRIVRFETKANNELEARLRQWQEYLRDLDRGTADKTSNYSTAVETRAMIEALISRLQIPPYQMDKRHLQHLATLDTTLRDRWIPGEFVWPDGWQPAYPKSEDWWLYGSLPSGTNH
ncbi:MAG: hypothetical protein R3C44_01985 [Chloroflexota bacterium]